MKQQQACSKPLLITNQPVEFSLPRYQRCYKRGKPAFIAFNWRQNRAFQDWLRFFPDSGARVWNTDDTPA
jgi:hypothetical protein